MTPLRRPAAHTKINSPLQPSKQKADGVVVVSLALQFGGGWLHAMPAQSVRMEVLLSGQKLGARQEHAAQFGDGVPQLLDCNDQLVVAVE
jgi:hypothetical protein